MSFLVEAALLVALVATSASVLAMHRRLRRLQAALVEYRSAYEGSAAALETASKAIAGLNSEGRDVVGQLGAEIAEGRAVLADLAAARRAA